MKRQLVKELIVEILGNEFPLSAKKIYNYITKKYGKQLTYHAVYKAINALLDSRVISKRETQYSLNKEYINRICDFANRVSVLYGQERPELIKEFPKEKFSIRILNSQYEMGLFVLNILNECRKNEVIAIAWPTIWPPMTNVPEVEKLIKSIYSKTNETYALSGKNGLLDRLFARKWEKLGMSQKLP